MSKDNLRPEDDRQSSPAGKTGASSRLGKEAKIGVSVIVVLLIILGAAVTMRLRGSSTDEVAATGDSTQGGKQLAAANSTEAMLKESGKLFKNTNPPVTLPKPAASGTPPKSVDSGLDSWKLPRDRSKTKSETAALPTVPPPFVTPSATPTKNRYENFGMTEPAGKAKGESTALAGAKPLVPDTLPATTAKKTTNIAADTKADASMKRPETSPLDLGVAGAKDLPPPPATTPMASNWRHSSQNADAPPNELAALPPYRQQPSSYSSGLAGSSMAVPATTTTGYDDPDDSRPIRRTGLGARRSAPVSSYSAAPRRDDGKYEVQPNDSYYKISERLYGTGAYFKALAQHNRGKDGEDRLKPGELILAPADFQVLEQAYPDLCPKPGRRDAMQSQSQAKAMTVSSRGLRSGRIYTVVEGDTLFNIARYELGKASRWAELYELNRDVLGKDFNYLTPGTQLTLPESERGESMARQPSSGHIK